MTTKNTFCLCRVNRLIEQVDYNSIDDALHFYAVVLDTLINKKKEYQNDENHLFKALKKLNFEKEKELMSLDDSETSDEE